jgi:hypothetical protein
MRTLVRPLESGADTPWWKRIDPWVAAEWGAVALVSLFYVAFKTYAMWLRAGDEHIYFAMAQDVAHGALPYRDFFFAHPPVHLLVPAVLFRILGFSYGLAFWIAPLACLAGGLALWRLVRRFAPGWAGVLALVLFVFGRTVLQSSSHLTGVNIGLMLLLWGAERLAANRPKTGGTLLALAAMTGLYFLPAALGILACFALLRPRPSLGALGLFLLVGFGLVVVFDLLSRGQFLEQVLWYHRAKGPAMGSAWPTFDTTKGAELFHNWPLFLGAIIAGFVGLVGLLLAADPRSPGRAAAAPPAEHRRPSRVPGSGPSAGSVRAPGWGRSLAAALRDPLEAPAGVTAPPEPKGRLAGVERARRKLVAALEQAPWAALALVGSLWVAAHWMMLANLAVVWRYYYAVVFAGAAVATAMLAAAVWYGVRGLPGLLRAKARGAAWAPVAFAGLIVLAFGAFYGHDLKLGEKYKIWAEESPEKEAACDPQACAFRCTNDGYVAGGCEGTKGCVCRYGWQDSPAPWVPGWFNGALQSLLWGGETIPNGRRYGALENTLWHESRGAAQEVRYLEAARAIAREACPGDTIFGDSGTAPMLANLTGLRIAGRVYDTNQQRFSLKFIDPVATASEIQADGVRFFVVGRNSWAKPEEPLGKLLKSEFRPLWPAQGDEPFGLTVHVRQGPAPCEPGARPGS